MHHSRRLFRRGLGAAEGHCLLSAMGFFLQAGVGAMAGALTGFFADIYKGRNQPLITIVEPDKADCNYRTAKANDGTLHTVTGSMNTIMAGLACGEPSTIGWNILSDYADYFVSIPDWIAAKGMRVLGNPLRDDPRDRENYRRIVWDGAISNCE